ncbi:MAG: diguanylate cyclase [Pseudobutyrivibrio sp.]|nr:diguanylate cyclase [Pseudobutyrivibrio sp.]
MAYVRLKNSLKSQMMRMTLIPLIFMTIIIVAVSASVINKTIIDSTHKEFIRDAKLAVRFFDEEYAGDFWAEDADGDGEVEMYKGKQRLNGEYTVIDDVAKMLDIDISIFYDDKRLLTTLKGSDGQRAIGTSAAVVVRKNVLEEGKSEFYTNVLVYDNKSFAYYEPLKRDDGTIYGMISVGRAQAEIFDEITRYMWPIILACLIIALLIGFIMVGYNRRLGNRIIRMDKYMNTLSSGEFDAEIPRELMAEDDEIKRLAVDGKSMAKAIKTLVEYDALTQLNNRRYGDKKLQEIRMKSVEMGVKYCICIADIDFFKKVNDTYGHEMGDEVLRAVADKLKVGMVGKGIAARWGGEEFLLIFENRELDIARRELSIIMDDIRTIYVPDTDRQITMSFGLTAMIPGESTDESLKRADENLYEAKETGRNQIICK